MADSEERAPMQMFDRQETSSSRSPSSAPLPFGAEPLAENQERAIASAPPASFPAPAAALVPVSVVHDAVIEAPDGLALIGPVASERASREWALVLQSMGIWHARRPTMRGFVLWVRPEDETRARASIANYQQENRDWPPRPVRERPRFPFTPVAPIAFLALIAFFVVTGPANSGSIWFSRGTSVADLVVRSEPWRAVTALTLHADSSHILGNAISGSIFAGAVNRRLGPGGGSLAVVAAGILGNLTNAFWYVFSAGSGHASIGASTAVFGAVGILAATQAFVNRRDEKTKRTWLTVLAPIVGGLALLGTLGAGPTSDLKAHGFGFLWGVVLGVFFSLVFRLASSSSEKPPLATRWWAQTVLGALALGVVVGSWELAMVR